MPLDLKELLDPSSTAVLVMELQRGVVGDLSALPDLAAAARPIFPAVRRLLEAARSVGVPVVHCHAGPPSVATAAPNYPLASALAKRSSGTPPPPEHWEWIQDIDPRPTDHFVARGHGMSPFTGTQLDANVRRLGARTVVACGVSLNVGIIGLCAEAVGLGYRVVVARDAVAGTPREHADSVMEHTIRMLATRLTVAEMTAVWTQG
jgi:nicotinamidase-related amidase